MYNPAALARASASPAEVTDAGHPLAVDLDGTLISADALHEGFLTALRAAPDRAGELLGTLREGKASFKRRVAAASPVDPSLLPYNRDLLAFLRDQKARGRRIGLFTAAHQSIAQAIADHLGLFDVVRGSDGETNLSGTRKLAAIREAFGSDFAYVGDHRVDRPIFEAARSVLLVGPVGRLLRFVPSGTAIEGTFPAPRFDPRVWAKALRLGHWAKNALVFVAPLLSLQILAPATLAQSLLLFVLMGLMASGTYLVNDAFDLAADRAHPVKRNRPLAAGLVSVRDALVVAAGLVVTSLALSLLLPLACMGALLAYFAVTHAYSFALKRQPIVDVFVLAGLFTLRILAGGAVIAGAVSPWLLTFSMLFFLGLATVKRYAELERVVREGGEGVVSRGYTAKDLPLLLAAGVGSSFGAIVVFMTYLINDQYPKAVYGTPDALWVMMPIVLLWTLRIWHLTVHGRMNEDPVDFALKDRTSLVLGLLAALTFAFAWS